MFKKFILISGLLSASLLIETQAHAGDTFVFQAETGHRTGVVWEGTEGNPQNMTAPQAPPPAGSQAEQAPSIPTWWKWMSWFRSLTLQP